MLKTFSSTNHRASPALWLIVIILAGVAGCAHVPVASITTPDHPKQQHLENLLASLLPHTDDPHGHYWVRVTRPTKASLGLWVLPQRHIYISNIIAEGADDKILTALLAHGVSHNVLHHQIKRNAIQNIQYVAFLVGGFFVPGLGLGWFLSEPALEAGMSFAQELTADAKTVTYLEPLGYSVDDYIQALEFLEAHHQAERAGKKKASTQRDFSKRIAKLRKSEKIGKSENRENRGQVLITSCRGTSSVLR